MPKNIVVIDDDKSETCNEDLAAATDEKSLERVSLSAESLLKAASVRGGKNSSLNCSRAEKGVARVVNITSPGHDTPSRCPTTTASVSATTAPRSVKENYLCLFLSKFFSKKRLCSFFTVSSLRIYCRQDFEKCLMFKKKKVLHLLNVFYFVKVEVSTNLNWFFMVLQMELNVGSILKIYFMFHILNGHIPVKFGNIPSVH